MAKLSIIIPVYNSEKTLSRCIDSIRNQTINNWELILVNDGSTDNSAEICEKYAVLDNRIVVINAQNQGSGPARNLGLDRASGDYIAFVDSDDRICENTYENCVRICEKVGCDILLFGSTSEIYDDKKEEVISIVNDDVPIFEINSMSDFRDQFLDIYKSCDLSAPWNKIYKKSLIDKYYLRFPDMRRMQDGVFNFRYFDKISSFCSIKENYYIRTWHTRDFQAKKMPDSLVDCIIKYHSEAVNLLKNWDKYDLEAQLVLGREFSECLTTTAFDCAAINSTSIWKSVKYIKSINNNKYVHDFLKEYRKIKKLRKLEFAMLLKLNITLAIYLKHIKSLG